MVNCVNSASHSVQGSDGFLLKLLGIERTRPHSGNWRVRLRSDGLPQYKVKGTFKDQRYAATIFDKLRALTHPRSALAILAV